MTAIFFDTLKRNYKLLLIFILVLNLYQGTIISLADPQDMSQMVQMFEFAAPYLDAFGINTAEFSSVLNYTASVFFGVLVMAFTMVFYVIQSTALIAKPVADTSIANLLMTPVKRTNLVIIKGLYLLFSISLLFLSVFITGTVLISLSEDFDVLAYLNLVFVNCALACMVAMLSYFFSVVFCHNKWGVNLAVAVPIALIFMNILGGVGEDLSFIKNLSPFGHINAVDVATGDINTLPYYILFISLSLILLISSAQIFKRKNLCI